MLETSYVELEQGGQTNNKDVRLVDTEEALNAGHCDEPDSETQFCALVTGIEDVRASKAINGLGSWKSFRFRFTRCLGLASSFGGSKSFSSFSLRHFDCLDIISCSLAVMGVLSCWHCRPPGTIAPAHDDLSCLSLRCPID